MQTFMTASLHRLLCGLFLWASLLAECCVHADNVNQHATVVLCGATGDLARKYLWQSIFNIYSDIDFGSVQENNVGDVRNNSISVIGAARTSNAEFTMFVSKLQDKIECHNRSHHGLSPTECENKKKSFISGIKYAKVSRRSNDLNELCNEIEKDVMKEKQKNDNVKINILMYMAIPTTSYVSFVEYFKKTCHTVLHQSDVGIRWGLEKPFGVDGASAENDADKLLQSFDDNEIYHIDHYLHKSIVKSILSFRHLNQDLEKLWNGDNIERVEIFLKETLDVKGRAYYLADGIGVLRDIHQNHLTELLTLIAMELPVNVMDPMDVSKRKVHLLRQIASIESQNSLFGQYADYAQHASLQMSNNNTRTSDVPTFAAVLVKINSARWNDVPFLLVSGKQLDRKESYVRVVFKDRNVCVCGCQMDRSERESESVVIFHIGSGDLIRPAILVSRSVIKPLWPQNMEEIAHISDNLFKSKVIYKNSASHFYIGVTIDDIPAYQSIMIDLIHGKRHNFVTTQRLILSWRIWDYIITANKSIRIYEQGDPHKMLAFRFSKNYLEFVTSGIENEEKLKYVFSSKDKSSSSLRNSDLNQSSATFLGWKLVSASDSQLPLILAGAIAESAEEAVKTKGIFHIALSGGTSIAAVLQSLAQTFQSLPWDSIHVWQVDERCVPHHEDNSNFGMIDRNLLRYVNIPFSNIHSLPVNIGGKLCDETLGGAHLYTESIKNLVHKSEFDMVVLGVGTDGHTASLFPGSRALHVDSDTFVTISNDGPRDTKTRMTLTLPLINRSKQIVVLVTGSHKMSILQQLESSSSGSMEKFPILGVHPSNGTLTWYIDHLALIVI